MRPGVPAVVDRPRVELSPGDRLAVESALRGLAARDGRVTPESFLAEAEPEGSPLHRLFEWDDTVAAFQHRLHQARQIVRTVVYRMSPPGAERREVAVTVRPAERAWVRQLAERRRAAGDPPPGIPAPGAAASPTLPPPLPPAPAPAPRPAVAAPPPPPVPTPRRVVVPVRVRLRDDPDLVVPELEVLQDVSADAVGDREDFVAEMVEAFDKSEGRLRVEDLARACWDGGYNCASLTGARIRGRS